MIGGKHLLSKDENHGLEFLKFYDRKKPILLTFLSPMFIILLLLANKHISSKKKKFYLKIREVSFVPRSRSSLNDEKP